MKFSCSLHHCCVSFSFSIFRFSITGVLPVHHCASPTHDPSLSGQNTSVATLAIVIKCHPMNMHKMHMNMYKLLPQPIREHSEEEEDDDRAVEMDEFVGDFSQQNGNNGSASLDNRSHDNGLSLLDMTIPAPHDHGMNQPAPGEDVNLLDLEIPGEALGDTLLDMRVPLTEEAEKSRYPLEKADHVHRFALSASTLAADLLLPLFPLLFC